MAEPKFVAKDGQVDYTNIRYCPVINAVVTKNGRVLLFKRGAGMQLYPNVWHCVGGFLDDNGSIEDKVREELLEEAGIEAASIVSMRRGTLVINEAPKYNKTFIVIPVLVEVKDSKFTLNWESQDANWYTPTEALALDLMPGFATILKQFFKT